MMKIESMKTIIRSRSSSSSSDDDDVHSNYSSSDSDLSLIETSAINSTKYSQQRTFSTSNSIIAQGTILRDTNNNFWMIHQCLQVSHRSERFLYLCSQVKRSITTSNNVEENFVKTKISPLKNFNEKFQKSRENVFERTRKSIERSHFLFYAVTIGESNKEIDWFYIDEEKKKSSRTSEIRPTSSIDLYGNEIVRGIFEFLPQDETFHSTRINKYSFEFVFLQEKPKQTRIENSFELIEEILKKLIEKLREIRRKNSTLNVDVRKYSIRKNSSSNHFEIEEKSLNDDNENVSSSIKYLLKLELCPTTRKTTRRKKHFTIDDEIAFYSRFATHEKLKSYIKRHNLMYIAIPEYIGHGTYKHLNFNWKFLILEQYRENLRSLIYSYDQSLPEHNALNLFLQMLYVIQYLHEKNHVHQIIKPKYMMFANKQPFFIYLTQFRTVRSVDEIDEKSNEVPNEIRSNFHNENFLQSKQQNSQVKKKVKRSHRTQITSIPNKTSSIVPTILPVIDIPSPIIEEEYSINRIQDYFHPFSVYSSLDIHLHDKQTYRGDLEMLGYNLIVWSGGQLPWEKKNHRFSMKFQRETITNEKKLAKSNVNEFVKKCFFMKLISPVTLRAICDYMSTIYQMNIDDMPNFDQLRAPIKEIVKALGFKANACLRLSNSKSKTTNQLNNTNTNHPHSSSMNHSNVKNINSLNKNLTEDDLNSPAKEFEVERDDLDDEDETDDEEEDDDDDDDDDEDDDDDDEEEHPCPPGSVSCDDDEDETSTDDDDDVQMEQQAPSISGSSINHKCQRCGGDHSLEDQQSQTSSDKQSNSSVIATSNNHSNVLTYQQKRQRSIAKRLQLRRKKKN